MALIQCPECKKEISDKTASCPHCGCPKPEPKKVPIKSGNNTEFTFGFVMLVLIVVCPLIIWNYISEKDDPLMDKVKHARSLFQTHMRKIDDGESYTPDKAIKIVEDLKPGNFMDDALEAIGLGYLERVMPYQRKYAAPVKELTVDNLPKSSYKDTCRNFFASGSNYMNAILAAYRNDIQWFTD